MTPPSPAPGPQTLEVAGVSIDYGSRSVLVQVDARLARSDIVAVIGPNGVGKSSLLKACLHLVQPSRGEVRLGGQPVADLPVRERAQHLAWLPQQVPWSFPFRAGEVVLMGRHPHRTVWGFESDQDRSIARRVMEWTGTWDLRDRLLASLSGGEAQRVLLAGALAQEPAFLILDEPTASLDLHHQAEFLALLRQLPITHGTGVLMASHDLSLAAAVADRLWLLGDGRLVADGPPRDVLVPELLSQVYDLPCQVQEGPDSLRVLPLWSRRGGGESDDA